MIRIIYHVSTEHPSTMTITQVQENSELIVSQSIMVNEITDSGFMNVIDRGLQDIPASDTEEDSYGGAVFTWQFD